MSLYLAKISDTDLQKLKRRLPFKRIKGSELIVSRMGVMFTHEQNRRERIQDGSRFEEPQAEALNAAAWSRADLIAGMRQICLWMALDLEVNTRQFLCLFHELLVREFDRRQSS